MQAWPSPLPPPCLPPSLPSPPSALLVSLRLLPWAAFWPPETPSQPGWIHSGSHGTNLSSRARSMKRAVVHLTCFTDEGNMRSVCEGRRTYSTEYIQLNFYMFQREFKHLTLFFETTNLKLSALKDNYQPCLGHCALGSIAIFMLTNKNESNYI